MDPVSQMAKVFQNIVNKPECKPQRRKSFSLTPMSTTQKRRSSSACREFCKDVGMIQLPSLLTAEVVRRRSFSGELQPRRPSKAGSLRDIRMTAANKTKSSSRVNLTSDKSSIEAFGKLNPSIYKRSQSDDEEQNKAYLQFSLHYSSAEEKLTMRILKAKNLPRRNAEDSTSCDPIIRVYLLPDEKRYLQSQPRRATTNPEFNEEFTFMVPQKRLSYHTVHICIYDLSRHKKHLHICSCAYSLSRRFEPNVIKQELKTSVGDSPIHAAPMMAGSVATSGVGGSDPTSYTPSSSTSTAASEGLTKGGVLLELAYNSTLERLSVTVLDAVELESATGDSPPTTYAKVTMHHQTKPLKSKKTSSVRDNCKPSYGECFNFHLSTNDVGSAHICVQVKQKAGTGRKDMTLGRVSIGSRMFCRGIALEHWEKMLQNPKQQIRMWHVIK